MTVNTSVNGQRCAELETCLCKLLYLFLHKTERALGVWLEDRDEGWHNTIQGGVYRRRQSNRRLPFSSLSFQPPSPLCTLRLSFTLTTSS